MTPEQKIKKVSMILVGLDEEEMTQTELQIRDILEDREATLREKNQARLNSSSIMGGS